MEKKDGLRRKSQMEDEVCMDILLSFCDLSSPPGVDARAARRRPVNAVRERWSLQQSLEEEEKKGCVDIAIARLGDGRTEKRPVFC